LFIQLSVFPLFLLIKKGGESHRNLFKRERQESMLRGGVGQKVSKYLAESKRRSSFNFLMLKEYFES